MKSEFHYDIIYMKSEFLNDIIYMKSEFQYDIIYMKSEFYYDIVYINLITRWFLGQPIFSSLVVEWNSLVDH